MRKEWNNIMLLDCVTKEFSEKENNEPSLIYDKK